MGIHREDITPRQGSLCPECGCHWQILSTISVDGRPVEVIAAHVCDGIGVVSQWLIFDKGWEMREATTEDAQLVDSDAWQPPPLPGL